METTTPHPTVIDDEGDDISLLLFLLLERMDRKKFFSRMQKTPNFNEFISHNLRWILMNACAPWQSMTLIQKGHLLRQFMLNKFSLDPRGLMMTPEVGMKHKIKNNAKWDGFYLYDSEMEELVEGVMMCYVRGGERDTMRVVARLLNGETYECNVDPWTRVADVKDMVFNWAFPVSPRRSSRDYCDLVHNGGVLHRDNDRLFDIGVTDGDEIQVIYRLVERPPLVSDT